MSRIVDAISECGFHWTVVDFERGDGDAVTLIHNSFANVLDPKHGTVRRHTVVLDANTDVVLVRLLEVRHHVGGADGPPHLERHVASRCNQPTRQPEIWKADDVIRVQVRKEDTANRLPRYLELRQSLQRTAARVE
jgi:hypothetical protein